MRRLFRLILSIIVLPATAMLVNCDDELSLAFIYLLLFYIFLLITNTTTCYLMYTYSVHVNNYNCIIVFVSFFLTLQFFISITKFFSFS